jgi:hypothetical protein
MIKTTLGICLLIINSGCVFINKSPDGPPLTHVSSLKELEGSYQNKATGGDPHNPFMLSKIIWAYDESINHNHIHIIAVRAMDNNTLEVKALNSAGETLKTDCFICNKQFKFVDGKICLRSGWHTMLGPDDPVLGPKYEWIELGLDTKGDGKYRSGGSVAGLAYLFFPVIAVGEKDVRFVKIKN